MTRTVQPLTWITATGILVWTLLWALTCCAESQAERSTVLIEINSGSPMTSKLTGVIVRATDTAAIAATCAHGWRGESPAARVVATRRDGRQAVGRRIWTGNPSQLDVALVRLVTRTKWPQSPVIARTPTGTEHLWTIGYPRGSRRQVIHRARYLGVSGMVHAAYATAGPIQEGESGSPVIAVDGVVAMVWGYDEQHYAMATPARRFAGAVETQWRRNCPTLQSPVRRPVVPIIRPPATAPPATRQDAIQRALANIDKMQATLRGITAGLAESRAEIAATQKTLAELLASQQELDEQLHNVQTVPGPPGTDGACGPAGPAGTSPTVAEILKQLPPIHVQIIDAEGNVAARRDVPLGGDLPLQLIPQ